MAGNRHWWRRGDSAFRGFRRGLDYAFIRALTKSAWMRSVLFATTISLRILVPALALPPRRVYESLQGRPEVGLLPTPRRCHAAPERAPSGFTDVSSVFQSVFTDRRDPLIEPPSASARLQDLRT
jgi:hypothetical protein